MVDKSDLSKANLKTKSVKRVRAMEQAWAEPIDQIIRFMAETQRESKRVVASNIGVHFYTLVRILDAIDPDGTIDWPSHGLSAGFQAKTSGRSEGGRGATKGAKLVTAGGVTQTVAEWSRQNDIPAERIYTRLRSGWKPEDAVSRKPMSPKRVGQESARKRGFRLAEGVAP